jgi:hypothetical protein
VCGLGPLDIYPYGSVNGVSTPGLGMQHFAPHVFHRNLCVFVCRFGGPVLLRIYHEFCFYFSIFEYEVL